MKAKTVITAVAILASLAVVAGGLTLWKMRQLKSQNAGGGFEPPEAVQIVTARTAEWGPTTRLVGTAFAVRSVSLSNEVAGTIKDVLFESDTVFDQGAVLLTLDSSVEEADLAATEASIRVSQASVRAAEANIELWTANFNRMSSAVEQRAMAVADLDNARAQLNAAKAQRDRATAEIEQAQARANQVRATIAKKTIRAPFKCRTGLRNVHPGQYLAEGSKIVELQGVTDNIYVDFAVPQEYAQRVQRGFTVTATSEVLGDKAARIEVVAVDAVADRTTRNVRIRATVANSDGRLRPGMAVDVTVPVEKAHPVILVPNTAVRRASFGDHVFLVLPSEKKEDQPGSVRAKQRFVKLGAAVGSDIIVTEGLKEGDELAAGGSFKLRDGALVMKAPPPSPPPSPSPAGEKPAAAGGGH